MRGCIHIYGGTGKGKTTAAVGLAVRCAGTGRKVLFTQFLKGNTSGENLSLAHIPNIILFKNEEAFGFTFTMESDERNRAKHYYRNHFRETISLAERENVDMLILDELIDAYNLDMVDKNEVLHFLRTRPEELEIVMTGHAPANELVQLADYVTFMKKIKHPYDLGLIAREGIEM